MFIQVQVIFKMLCSKFYVVVLYVLYYTFISKLL